MSCSFHSSVLWVSALPLEAGNRRYSTDTQSSSVRYRPIYYSCVRARDTDVVSRSALGYGDTKVLPDGGDVLVGQSHNFLQVFRGAIITLVQHAEEGDHSLVSIRRGR